MGKVVFVVIHLPYDKVVDVFTSRERALEHYNGYEYYIQEMELKD